MTETCDPFYRFGICPTTYKYESLQIDYYNTCLNSSVSELNKITKILLSIILLIIQYQKYI